MKKNILVVDDSALMRRVICDIINSNINFQANDYCRDGLEAYEVLSKKKYDAVLLDVNMPRMDGIALLKKMKEDGIRATVLMVSTLTVGQAEVTLKAMELGAVDFVTKPNNIIEAKGIAFHDTLLDTLTAVFSTTNYVEQMRKKTSKKQESSIPKIPKRQTESTGNKKLIALACSTGGPKALHEVIPFLKKNMDAPMVLVQHMPMGFTKSMAERLDELSKVTVKEAEEGDILKKGVVYVAPGGKHLEIVCDASGVHRAHLNDDPPIGALKPCANVMFRSLCKSSYDKIVCVVLTGMGADGTEGILELNKCKSIHVIAQNAETCVVYGMPKAIADSGIVDDVVPLEKVAETILKNVGVQ